MGFLKTVARKRTTAVAVATSGRGWAAGIVVSLVAVTIFSVLAPSARANASAPPQIASLGYSPSSVDVGSGSASVTFTAHLTDGSPITGAYVSLVNSAASQQVNGQFERVSGTAEDGVWQATLSVPQGQRREAGITRAASRMRSIIWASAARRGRTSPFPRPLRAPSPSPTRARARRRRSRRWAIARRVWTWEAARRR